MERTDWRSHGLLVTHTRTEYAGTAKHHGTADDNVVRLHFGLRGDYSVTYPEIGRSYELAGGHHNVLFSSPFELEFVNKTPEIETFGVQFPISQFIAYTDGASDELSRFCERIAAGRPSVLFDDWAPMTPAIETTIRQIRDTDYTGVTGELFVLSKSIELLVQAIEAHKAPALDAYVKSASDRERIVAARDLINTRLTNPPSLSEVAKHIGLNEYKLKRGFKEMFGRTVFGYLTEQRLEIAHRALVETDKTAAEVAFELGYATPQHFHSAFKKYFGVTPNSVRKAP
jgi:AraC family transcriptional activator of pyochelin receptor